MRDMMVPLILVMDGGLKDDQKMAHMGHGVDRSWLELNQAHVKGEISSTKWQCGQLEDCP